MLRHACLTTSASAGGRGNAAHRFLLLLQPTRESSLLAEPPAGAAAESAPGWVPVVSLSSVAAVSERCPKPKRRRCAVKPAARAASTFSFDASKSTTLRARRDHVRYEVRSWAQK